MKQTTDKQVNTMQNDNAFTLGKWDLRYIVETEVWEITDELGFRITKIENKWRRKNINEANAALIASAPTLKAENEKLKKNISGNEMVIGEAYEINSKLKAENEKLVQDVKVLREALNSVNEYLEALTNENTEELKGWTSADAHTIAWQALNQTK